MQTRQDKTGQALAESADIKDRLLAKVARSKLTVTPPQRAGSCAFYEVASGWELDQLKADPTVQVATTGPAFTQLLSETADGATIFVPKHASITKTLMQELCRHDGQGQTIFFEETADEQI